MLLYLTSIGILFFFLFTASLAYANTEIKPTLNWQRSTESQNSVVNEDVIGTKVNQALVLPLDPNQVVFDNGLFTPQRNKSVVPQGTFWASWPQYSYLSTFQCSPPFDLRHFQAKFTLLGINPSDIQSTRLISSYYPNNAFPINDNAYIYLNGNFVKRLGTSYGASNFGFDGSAPYANEVDGWVANGDLGANLPFQSGNNTLDLVTGEHCAWGGMGKLELILEVASPQPFLELPWDYQSKGLTFNDAALAINSYFDHEYPLLGSGLAEPVQNQGLVTNFNGITSDKLSYSRHDGYDYGKSAKLSINDPVLAAAAGTATFIDSCGTCGNMLVIDHHNGYQTRYLHLQIDGLITNVNGQSVDVIAGQAIGKNGATGNTQGAHIHFGVFQDKNVDGNFNDNVPDGATDPYGWQSSSPDPWENYTFDQNDQPKTGNKSSYLWKNKLDNLNATLTSNAEVFNVGRYSFNFSQGATNQNLNLSITSAPSVQPTNILSSIGSIIVATATDLLGNVITQFQSLFTITVNFSQLNLTGFNLSTISFYSSTDGINWTKEPTTVDLVNNTATTQVNHLSYFALLAERLDTTAPETVANLNGEGGETNWFRSDVTVEIVGKDSEGGLGVDYTLYKIEGVDWEVYNTPLTFTNEGHYKIEFYSVDKDENIENSKSVEFDIDKTPPEAKISADINKPGFKIEGADQNQTNVRKEVNPRDNTLFFYFISDLSGNTLRLNTKIQKVEAKNYLEIYSLQYNNAQRIESPTNKFFIKQSVVNNKLIVEDQSLTIKGQVELKAFYNLEKDITLVTIQKLEEEKKEEQKSGLVLLQLNTNKGILGYNY